MKIISLNTWSGVILEPLMRFFENNRDIDVFCLQEIYKGAPDKEDRRHPTLDMKLDLFERIDAVLQGTHTGYFRPAHKDYYGQAMFLKNQLAIEEEGDVMVFDNLAPKERGRHGRNVQYARIPTERGPVLIANFHGLWNGMGKSDTDDRRSQSSRIKEFILGRSEEKKVLIGDFNLNPDTESLKMLEDSGLRNLVKEYGITSTRTSFYTKEGKYADYALVSPNIAVLDFKVLADEVSDHAPLYLEIA